MKKVFAFLLAAALMLSLVGCGATSDPSGDGTSGNKATALKVSDEFLESLKGLEMTIVYPWSIDESNVDTEAYDYKHLKELEKQYGFTVKTVGQGSGYESAMVTAVMSGAPLGNVMMCPENDFADWYYAGIMSNLNSAAAELGIDFANDAIYNKVVSKYTNVDGGQYGFNFGYENTAYTSLYYNKRILAENDLEDPHTLQERGEWTWDKLKEYAKKCQVAESDGTITLHGYGAWTINETLTAMIYSNDGDYCKINADGQLEVNLKDPKTTQAMETYYDWCNTDKTIYVSEGGWKAAMQDFVNGSYAFMLGTNEVMTIANDSGMKDEFGMIAFPKGPSNTSNITSYQSNVRYWFIPVTYEKDAAKYLFIMDLIRRSDTRTYDERFEDDFFLKIADEASYEDYKKRLSGNDKYSLYAYSGISYLDGGCFFGLSNDMYYGYKTAGTLIDMYADSLNANLRDVWGETKITGK